MATYNLPFVFSGFRRGSHRWLRTMRSLREPVPIVFWSNSAETRRNWGDALNPLLVRALTGRMPVHASTVYALGRPVYAIIDILAGIEDVAGQVASCAAIASSSLHGLILADAPGIPNVRLKITDRVVGGDFKYRDYFESVGRWPEACVLLRPDTTVAEIEDSVFDGRIDIDLDALLACCPLPRPDG